MNEVAEKEMEVTPITEKVAVARKSMQVSTDNPIHAFQTIVARTNPEYIVMLHKLLGTFAECASELKK